MRRIHAGVLNTQTRRHDKAVDGGNTADVTSLVFSLSTAVKSVAAALFVGWSSETANKTRLFQVAHYLLPGFYLFLGSVGDGVDIQSHLCLIGFFVYFSEVFSLVFTFYLMSLVLVLDF